MSSHQPPPLRRWYDVLRQGNQRKQRSIGTDTEIVRTSLRPNDKCQQVFGYFLGQNPIRFQDDHQGEATNPKRRRCWEVPRTTRAIRTMEKRFVCVHSWEDQTESKGVVESFPINCRKAHDAEERAYSGSVLCDDMFQTSSISMQKNPICTHEVLLGR